MSFFRRTTLLVLALTAISVVTVPAAAGDPVGVTHEDGDADCGVILAVDHEIEGICRAHVVSDGDVVFKAMGTPVSSCENEVEAVLDRDGIGYVQHPVLTGGGLCTRQPCAEEVGEAVPWPIMIEEVGTDDYEIDIEICVTTSGFSPVTCDFEADLVVNSHSDMTIEAVNAPCAQSASLTVTGSWVFEEESEEYPELAIGPPRAAPPIRPLGTSNNFEESYPNHVDIRFFNHSLWTNYQILSANSGNPELTAPGGPRFTATNISCTNPTDFKWLNSGTSCEVRITKNSANTPPGPSGVYLWYRDPATGGGLYSSVYLLFR